MVAIGDVILRILGRDETAEATQSAEENFDGLSNRISSRAAVIAASMTALFASAAENVARLARAAEQRLADFDRSLGRVDAEARELRDQLIAGGVPEGIDVNAVVRTVETQLGGAGEPGARGLARTLIDFAVQTGNQNFRGLGRVAQGFEFADSPTSVTSFLNILSAQTQTRHLGVDETIQGLLEYGPVLREAGLNPSESLEFLADLAEVGINFSRVSPGINLGIQRGAEQGVPGRELLEPAFAAILNAPTSTEAVAAAQDLFGREGTLRLVDSLRRAGIGFGPQEIGLDPRVQQQPILGGFELTAGERIEAVRRRQSEGGILDLLALGIEEGITGVPIIGGPFGAALDQVRTFGGQRPRPTQTIVQVYGAVIDAGQVEGIARQNAPDDPNLIPEGG